MSKDVSVLFSDLDLPAENRPAGSRSEKHEDIRAYDIKLFEEMNLPMVDHRRRRCAPHRQEMHRAGNEYHRFVQTDRPDHFAQQPA